ncbi:Stk1 family PASTA domain-containing Ser/Thr kinase [Romboutsia weinsteinii]|uniref:non-specific serine/threonine protein kinase n=1 Tax=Romboutsia weinsteinii TaxID=2020949 RepID=A0A371J7N2_9FIRM|nr:Stk1 family PASTA domain-containing Ser/Thr kinase [Romboutsia weinsteinii]RDY28676.1 Stk1 family PASTA domain-containing Ser/Thr kinase [Romboutsia weinsteinii]
MGETILGNRYEIIRKIGDGGMAFVYEAKDKLLSRTVALKVLRPEFVDDDEFLGKFKREAEAVASLSHPNIVNVYDVGEDGKVHYIVMEFVDGQNLKEIIKDEGTLDEYTALDITKQIAMALSAAHKKGIIHRDIKPHNILISKEGRVVKVADFGIAKAVSNSTMTNIGSIIGSVHYFSPEQAKGKYVTNNADLYSLGIVLYEMLTGKVPFKGDSPISIALQHINDEIEFTSEERVSIPQSVRTIIKKLTEKSSADRYQSAEELIEDIEYIEKNIDLDFIKEYDNYATKKIDGAELNKAITPTPVVELNDEPDEDDGFEDDEKPSRLKKNKEKTKNKSKKKKMKKEDSPKTKKRLKIAAIILCLVLATQVFVALKLISGKTQNAGDLVAPSLEEMTLDEAQKELERLGLKLDIRRDEYNADIPKDSIISQMPASGTAMVKGDTISVVISKGAKKAAIPSIVGYTLEEAENILKENKLELGNVKQEYNEIYKAGVVLLQSPTSGNGSVEEGDKIDVVISKGPKKEEQKEEPKEDDKSDTTTNPPQNNNQGGSTTNPGTGGGGGGTTNPPTNTPEQPVDPAPPTDTPVPPTDTPAPPQDQVPQVDQTETN